MKINFQDRIDDYLLGRMFNEERNSFELEAAEDTELQEQLQFTKTVQKATKSRNEKLAAMEEWKDDYVWEDERTTTASAAEYRATGSGYDYCPAQTMRNRRVATSLSFKKMLYWVSSIAAVFIVGVFIFNLYNLSSTDLAMETASRPNELSNKNGNVSFQGNRHDLDIEHQLTIGNYSKALACIEKDEADIQAERMLLEREVHSRGGNYESAETKKNALEIKLIRLYYLKAHALIGLERKDEAMMILDGIRHSKSDYGYKADSLYQMLRE